MRVCVCGSGGGEAAEIKESRGVAKYDLGDVQGQVLQWPFALSGTDKTKGDGQNIEIIFAYIVQFL